MSLKLCGRKKLFCDWWFFETVSTSLQCIENCNSGTPWISTNMIGFMGKKETQDDWFALFLLSWISLRKLPLCDSF